MIPMRSPRAQLLHTTVLASFVALATALTLSPAACSIPPSAATITLAALPSETATEWNPVEQYLDHRCGGLDCHGDLQRNLIIYGCEGLRLDPNDVPGCVGPNSPPTTPAEYAATYRSLVALEPVVMSEVVAAGGQEPDLLTFVRKARGEEAHKGGTLIDLTTQVGIDQDDCITSWLSGGTNTNACTLAVELTP